MKPNVLLLLGLAAAPLAAQQPATPPPQPTPIAVGTEAPDFTLPSTTGEQISLSQFQGKQPVLLEFYAADFSPV